MAPPSAPNIKETTNQTKSSVCELDRLDEDDPVRLGKKMSMLVALTTLLFYSYAIYVFYMDYKVNYYQKEIIADQVTNYLFKYGYVYFISMFFEALYGFLVKRHTYDSFDTIGSIFVFVTRPICTRLFIIFTISFGIYGYIWEHYGKFLHAQVFPVWLQNNPFYLFLMIIVCDEFCYYWAHRLGHEVNILWAVHQTHHNGEYYNLGLATRDGIFGKVASIIFYIPLAFLFDPAIFIVFRQFNQIYQFWLHQEIVGKLGWLEYIFNTPSQHRVHHGRNAYCIDRNYGGMFCLFDRLFGTHQEEIDEVPVVYGLTTSIDSYDPLYANYVGFINIWKAMKIAKGFDKLKVPFKSPGWIPGTNESYPIPPVTRNSFKPFSPRLPMVVKLLIVCELFITLACCEYPPLFRGFVSDSFILKNTLSIFSLYTVWVIALIAERKSFTLKYQFATIFVWISLFALRSYHYYPRVTVIGALSPSIVAAMIIGILIYYKKEIQTPMTAEDYAEVKPFAPEAEKAQWEFYGRERTKKKKIE